MADTERQELLNGSVDELLRNQANIASVERSGLAVKNLVRLCHRRGCTVKLEYHYDATGMGKVINLRSTFETLCQELGRRLGAASPRDIPSQLSIKTDIGDVTLGLRGSTVSLSDRPSDNWVELPQWALIQLILGYRNVTDVLADTTVSSQGNASEVLQVLFPSGHPIHMAVGLVLATYQRQGKWWLSRSR